MRLQNFVYVFVAGFLLSGCGGIEAAQEAGLFDVMPIEKWLMPKVDQEPINPLTAAQVRQRLQAMKRYEPGLYPAVLWIAMTGNRPAEVRELQWSAIDMKSQTVERQQKGRHLARYQFSDEARKALDAVAGQHPKYVFVDVTGEPYEKKRLLRAWQRAQEKANITPVATLYDLRHSFASIMANELGCPLPILQQLLGHTSIEMTLKYVKPGDAADWLRTYGRVINKKGKQE